VSTAGQRMAAARLATLGRRDQRWILARLPTRERAVLATLLDTPVLRALSSVSDNEQGLPLTLDDSVEDRPNPIVAASAEALGASWAALWLSASHPDLLQPYLASQPAIRGRAIMAAQSAFDDLPPGLTAALESWVTESAA
jgi:hypothetical protein